MASHDTISVLGQQGLDDFLQHVDMYEHVDSVVAICGQQGDIHYGNPAFQKFRQHLGISSHYPDLEDVYDLDTLKVQVCDCVATAKQQHLRVKLYLSLNISIYITIKLTPISDKQTSAVLAVMLVIAEENLAFSKYRFVQQQYDNEVLKKQIVSLAGNLDEQSNLVRALLQKTPFAIMLIDPQGKVIQVNQAAEELLQVSVREMIGHSCDIYLDYLQCDDVCLTKYNHKELVQTEGVAFCADGKQKHILRSTVKLGELDNALILEAFIDITDRKLAEEELMMHRDNLELLVKERTQEMELARRESDRANRAKSDFLSRMSHDLRTPVNAMMGFAKLLEMSPELSRTDHKRTNHIIEAGEHLLSLISGLLDLSQIEAGAIVVHFEELKASEMVMEAMHYIETQADKRGITLDFKEVSKDLTVYVDRTRYQQILLNILSNAVKYNSDKGDIRVSVFANDKLDVCVEVKDTGLGIAAEDISKLCEPFVRLGAEKTNIEGSGVGLSVVKLLVERMDGQLQIESTVGQGSTFRVCFPSGPQ